MQQPTNLLIKKCKVRNVVGHPTKLSACPLYHKEVPHHSIRATPTAMPIAAMAHEISLSHVWEKKRNKNKIKQNKQPAFIRLMYACMHVWMYVCMSWCDDLLANQTRQECSGVRPGIQTLVNLSRTWVESNGQSAGQTLYLQGSSFAKQST
jgi:hypothetical protein